MTTPGAPDTSALTGFLLNLAAAATWAAVSAGGRRLVDERQTDNPRRRRDYVLIMSAVFVLVLFAALAIAVATSLALGWSLLLLALGTCIWGIAVLRELDRFWGVGLLTADRQIRQGLSYDASLRLIRNDLSFLGTGAHKLTKSPEFERAMKQCPPTSPIRFLLRRPDDASLIIAARKANKPDDQYQENLVESLRQLAKVHRAMNNLQVKFYEGDSAFRIMLIDRRLALVSFNVYGRSDDGSGLPQLILRASPEGRDPAESFFHSFEVFFDQRWRDADPWDFKKYL